MVQVVDADALEDVLAVHLVSLVTLIAVRGCGEEVVQAGVHHGGELVGRLLVIAVVTQGPGHPEIGLAKKRLAKLLGNTPAGHVAHRRLLRKHAGVDGIGQVFLDEFPQVLGAAVGLCIFGRNQFVVHDRRIAPERGELEIGPAAEQVRLGNGTSSRTALRRINVADDHVGVIDEVVVTGEGVEGEFTQGVHVHVVTVCGATRIVVVGDDVLHQHHVVVPTTDVAVHGDTGRLNLFVGLVVGIVVDNTLTRHIQHLVAGRQDKQGGQQRENDIFRFHKAVGIRK